MRLPVRWSIAIAFTISSTLAAYADEGPTISANAYIGAHGGWATSDEFPLNDESDLLGSSAIGGIHGGVDFRSGPLLLGLEIDYDWTNVDGTVVTSTPFGDFSESFKVEDLMSVRGRFGYAANSLLVYGTGGFAAATAEHTFESPFGNDRDEHKFYGFVFGGGLEYALTGNLSARIEALRYDLLDGDQNIDNHLDLSVVRAGFSLRTGEVEGNTGQSAASQSLSMRVYVGLHGGKSAFALDTGELDLQGSSGGVHAGVGVTHGNLYFGIEADYDDLSDVEDEASLFGVTASTEMDYAASLRARFGLANSSALWYATVGWAWSEVEVGIDAPAFGVSDSIDLEFNGMVAGGGVEVMLTDNISGRAEALVYRLYDTEFESRLDFNTYRAGLTYHFNQ